MRRQRLLAVATAVIAVAVPTLSMTSPPPAYGSHSAAAPPAAQLPTVKTPLVQTVFNHPSETDSFGNTDSYAINNSEFNLVNPASVFPQASIQVNMYRMSDHNLAQSLDDAADQGVMVQVLLDGKAETEGCHGVPGCVNPTFQTLEYLNTVNQRPGQSGTWLKTCSGYGPGHATPLPGAGEGCLGQTLNHNKFILVSKTVWQFKWIVSDVVMQTSSNDTRRQYTHASNNALIVANRPAVYQDYQRYFAREAASYRSTTPTSGQLFTRRSGTTVDSRTLRGNHIETLSYPRVPTDDPLLTALKSVSTAHGCANRSTDPNGVARTTIDLAMSTISGRGRVLQELATLARAGCPVHVVYTVISRAAYRALHQRHVSLQQLCTRTASRNHQPRYSVHSKYLLIAGTAHGLGRDRRITYTGSENLQTGSLTSADNRDIRYVEPGTDAPVYRAFRANFGQLRRLGVHNREFGYACKSSDKS
jgi:PLD-like domain